jgi:hypothetical protein
MKRMSTLAVLAALTLFGVAPQAQAAPNIVGL